MKKGIKCLALLGLSVSVAFAHETFNRDAQLGFDKTYSAQSMKHGQLGITVLGDISNDKGVFDGGEYYSNTGRNRIAEYYGGSAYIGMAFGMFEIVDVSIMLPYYYDHIGFDDYTDETEKISAGDAANQGYLGNLRASLKFRAPLPEDQMFDIALVLGADFPTTDANKRGIWIRRPDYINKDKDVGYAFGSNQSIFRTTAAVTMDLRKIDAAPLLFHLNGGYRFTVGNDEFPNFFSFAVGMEVYPLPVVSIFGEYYMDIADGDYKIIDNMGMNEASVGLVFHIGSHLDLQVGGHFAISKDYTKAPVSGGFSHDGSHHNSNGTQEKVWRYKTRTTPSAYGFGGITWSGFLIDPDRDGDGVPDSEDKCPDEAGDKRNDGCPWANPDLDEDGICDSWVAEKGLHAEFADICEGIDRCPNEPGNGSDGCPLDNPDVDADGVCDPWVAQKNMLAQFKGVCEGIDECPSQAGDIAFNGCPSKNPDPDQDSICSPWVTDEGRLADFADVCKGYDMCPGEAGPVANKGCPWPDPDVDGDGLCDAWVTEKGLGYFFENPTDPNVKQCKGVDKCPAEYGPVENDGCPLENPDPDKDSVCSPWVSEKDMLDDYKSVCTGVDKCPNEAGPLATGGCPTEDPDVDKDSVCDPWVTQKGMLDVFKDVCTGLDKCPYDSGSVKNNGCPLDNPDSDNDSVCDPWVTQKGMLDMFKDVCTGLDKCPLDSGSVSNNGCPLDNPDSDNDGVCDPWVTQKGMLDMFKDKCTGLDKCPYEAGSAAADGCPVEDIKLEVYFSSGKSKLTANSKRTLRELAKNLNSKERKNERYQILGYTDDRGKESANLKLSQQRANAVVTELVKNGVDKSRLEAVGMGEADPIADNSTAEGRELNRRIMMKRIQ